jgi:hypothetical protein
MLILGRRLKMSANDQETMFYKEMKDSVTLNKYTDVDDRQPGNLNETCEQLEELHANLKSHKRMQTYIKCLMGRNLLSIKKITQKKGTDFITYAHQYIPKTYSKSEIHFMINLHKLSEEYPRISFISLPIRKLKTQFKLIKKLVIKESEYWKSTV